MAEAATTNDNPRRTLREQRRRLRRERMAVALELQEAKLRQSRQLLEHLILWDDTGMSGFDLWANLRGRTTQSGQFAPPTHPSDRRAGRNWPFWQTDLDLDFLRQRSRVVCTYNAYAKGLLRNRTNHIIGRRFNYKAQSKENLPDADPVKAGRQDSPEIEQLVAAAQDVIDGFLRLNHWNGTIDPRGNLTITGSREREILRRVDRDGECFLEYFPQDNGTLLVRFIEPECIRNPPGGDVRDGWSFGIQHQMEPEPDVEVPLRYFVYHTDPQTVEVDLTDRENWSHVGRMVPADEVLHVKGPDTDSTLKRGIPAFAYGTAAALERARVLQRNASIGAAVRAATAEIWKHHYGTAAEIQGFANSQREYSEDRTKADGTSATDSYEWAYPGMTRRVPEGQEPVFPAPDNTASYLTGVQGDLREAGAAFAAPEYWTGDSSNGNYSSLETATSPAVKNGEVEQDYYTAVCMRVAWKAIEVAVAAGKLDKQALTLLDILVEGPAVLHRNELQDAQVKEIERRNGVLSPQTWCAEKGRDAELEFANIQEYEDRFGQQGMTLPLPGEPGAEDGSPGLNVRGDGSGPGMEARLAALESRLLLMESLEADDWVSRKIKKLRGEGYDQDQAVAIALHMAREKGLEECGGEGGTPGPCPQGGSDAHAETHARAGKLAALGEKLSAAGKAAVAKAGQYLANKYADLEKDFGRKGAIAIIAATVALTPVPLPGTSLAPIALAKGYLAVRKRLQGA